MAYTANYEYDIFISYARIDDEAGAGDGRPWVRDIVDRLERALAIHMGGREKLKVFFDEHEFKGGKQLSDLLDAAQKSAVFLAIASPAYSKRDWTRQELAAFCRTDDPLKRLFAFEYFPLAEGDAYPEPLQSHRREPFWKRLDGGRSVCVPLAVDEPLVFPKIMEQADLIHREFKRLNAAAASAAPVTPAEVRGDEAKDVVFLAQTTDDLEEERDGVRRELEQYGYLVVPSHDYPQGGIDFRNAVAADLDPSRYGGRTPLFVQLLGPRPGRRPADLPEGYPRAQFDLASSMNCHTMLWHRSDLDIDTVADQEHRALLRGEHVVASGLEAFKADIRRKLEERQKKAPPPPPADKIVFINANQNDREAATRFIEEFGRRKLPAFAPLFEGSAEDVHADLKEKITDCDVLVLLYGKAPLSWVHSQARLVQKLRHGSRAKVVALLVGPPPDEKPPTAASMGFTLPDLRWIEARDAWNVDPVVQLISELPDQLH